MTRSAHGSASRAGGEGQIAKLPATMGCTGRGIDSRAAARAALQCACLCHPVVWELERRPAHLNRSAARERRCSAQL